MSAESSFATDPSLPAAMDRAGVDQPAQILFVQATEATRY